MSKEQNVPGSDGKDQAQPEIPLAAPGVQSVDPQPSIAPLMIENLKKLQEEYPVAKSSLARQTVETYLQQSIQIDEQNEASRKESNLPHGKESEAVSIGPLQEYPAENYPEASENISSQARKTVDHVHMVEEMPSKESEDFQTRSLTPSVLETKKCEFADLETQTEWSYSSAGSSGKARKTVDHVHMVEEMPSKESEEGSSVEDMADLMLDSLFSPEDHEVTDDCYLGCCEFCAAAIKPFPTPEELGTAPEKMESVPCCRTYREILQIVMQELMAAQSTKTIIDITPHPRLSQGLLKSRTKNHLKKEIQEYGIENYKDVFTQYMRPGPCAKIVFKISNDPPKPTPVAIKKRPHAKDLLKMDLGFKPEHLKICHPVNPVKRYYPDGKIFFLLLPDGTGQVYYPSGNIAILITYIKDVQFTYIVLSDSPYNRLIAFFTNQGNAACYYLNRKIRVNLDLCSGFSFDEQEFPLKRWSWWDPTHHVHAPPFQPMFIKLNIYIQVKIVAQDQILLTFTKLHNCISLNVGARLKLKDPAMLPLLKSSKSWDPFVSHTKMVQIRTLLAKLQQGLSEKPSRTALMEPPRPLDQIALFISYLQRWRNTTLTKMRKLSGDSSS